MKQLYISPSITSLNSSKIYFSKNQATCDLNILNGRDLVNVPSFSSCGRANFNGNNRAEICLSGSVTDVSQLNGLILQGFSGQEITIDSCIDIGSGSNADCPGTAYLCTDVDGNIADDRCIISIHCADGTELTDCDNQVCLVVTDGLTNGL